MIHQLNNTIMNEKIHAADLVEITGTGGSKFLPEGVKKTVHRIAGEKLVAAGHATMGDEIAETVLSPKKKGRSTNKPLEM